MKKGEILKIVEEIDREYRDEGIPIPKRPIGAIVEFGRRVGISLPLVSTGRTDIKLPYPVENELITDAIHEWYKNTYGQALNIDFSPGSSLVDIEGNIYEMKIPKIWGSADAIWGPISNQVKDKSIISNRGTLTINVPEHIEKLTPSLAEAIKKPRQLEIIVWFSKCFQIFNFLRDKHENWRYSVQILTNIDTSVRYILSSSPNYGESKWASLQATEKTIKSILIAQGHNPKHNHNLSSLASDIKPHPALSVHLLKDIQCSAGARYGDESVTFSQAVKAHNATLEFIFGAMKINV